jgi:hypothetical protein
MRAVGARRSVLMLGTRGSGLGPQDSGRTCLASVTWIFIPLPQRCSGSEVIVLSSAQLRDARQAPVIPSALSNSTRGNAVTCQKTLDRF